jgi:hypothetical protein
MDEAIFSNDDKAIQAALQQVLDALEGDSSSHALHITAAKGYLARADLLRVDRQTGSVPPAKVASMRDQQAAWGEAGAGHASKAKALARDKPEKSEAYRLAGECTVHRISGPISGIRHGPTAKSDIEFAVAQDPANWEAQRALGLMYLNNPPINGGDLDKAVETFTLCAEQGGDRDVHHALLAQAWIKKRRPERARLEVLKALERNPRNRMALNIQSRLKENGQW